MSMNVRAMDKRRICFPVKEIIQPVLRMMERDPFHDLICHHTDSLQTGLDEMTGIDSYAHGQIR